MPTPATIYTPVCDLRPFAKSINVRVIVLSKCNLPWASPISIETATHFPICVVEEKRTSDHRHTIYSFLVADQSAAVILNLWDAVGAGIREADILLVLGGFVTMYRGYMRFACRVGRVCRIGSFTMTFSEAVNVSMWEWRPDPQNPGQLVRVFV